MAKKKEKELLEQAIMEQMGSEPLELNANAPSTLEDLPNGKRKTFSISLDADFLEELKTEAKLNHISMNALVSMYLSEGQARRKKARLKGYDD